MSNVTENIQTHLMNVFNIQKSIENTDLLFTTNKTVFQNLLISMIDEYTQITILLDQLN